MNLRCSIENKEATATVGFYKLFEKDTFLYTERLRQESVSKSQNKGCTSTPIIFYVRADTIAEKHEIFDTETGHPGADRWNINRDRDCELCKPVSHMTAVSGLKFVSSTDELSVL